MRLKEHFAEKHIASYEPDPSACVMAENRKLRERVSQLEHMLKVIGLMTKVQPINSYELTGLIAEIVEKSHAPN